MSSKCCLRCWYGILSLLGQVLVPKLNFSKLPKLVKSFDYLVNIIILLNGLFCQVQCQSRESYNNLENIWFFFISWGVFDFDCILTTFLQRNLRFAKQQKETRNHQSWKQQKTTQTDIEKLDLPFLLLFHFKEIFNFEGNLTWKLNPALTAFYRLIRLNISLKVNFKTLDKEF